MIGPLINLVLEAHDCDCAARINDIPLAAGRRGYHRAVAVPLAEYLLPGQNRLDLTVPGGEDAPPEGAEVLARVALYAEGEVLDPEGGQALASLRPALTPGRGVQVGADFTAPPGAVPAEPWAWARAPRLEGAVTRADLDAYAMLLVQAFAARDAAALLAEFAPAMADRLRAYPAVAPDDARGAFLAQFDGTGDWVPMPAGPGDIVWRPAAGGRLAEALGRDGRPLLRTAPARGEPGAAEFAVLVGLHAGRLRILA